MSNETKTTPKPELATEHPGVAAMVRKFRLAGDVVNKATADLPDADRSAIRWLHAFATERDLSMQELGQLIRYDASTVYRVLTGKYEGSLHNVVGEINSVRRLEEERRQGRKLDFVHTTLTKRIWKVCDAAVEYQRIAFIFGDTQTGKTTALMRYRDEHNHGNTIYVRMPAGGAMLSLLESLAVALRMSAQSSARDMRLRILGAFDARMLLIVDEVHQCVMTKSDRAVRSMEFLRELHDTTGCGVVLCGTNVFRDEMETGRLAGVLKQCKRRRLVTLQLPSQPTPADLATFAKAYELPPADGEALRLQTDVIRDEALGMWLTLLRMSSKIASKRGQKMEWRHVCIAHAGLRELEGGAL